MATKGRKRKKEMAKVIAANKKLAAVDEALKVEEPKPEKPKIKKTTIYLRRWPVEKVYDVVKFIWEKRFEITNKYSGHEEFLRLNTQGSLEVLSAVWGSSIIDLEGTQSTDIFKVNEGTISFAIIDRINWKLLEGRLQISFAQEQEIGKGELLRVLKAFLFVASDKIGLQRLYSEVEDTEENKSLIKRLEDNGFRGEGIYNYQSGLRVVRLFIEI